MPTEPDLIIEHQPQKVGIDLNEIHRPVFHVARVLFLGLDRQRRKFDICFVFVPQAQRPGPRLSPGPGFDVFNAALRLIFEFIFGLVGKFDLFPLNAGSPGFIPPGEQKIFEM